MTFVAIGILRAKVVKVYRIVIFPLTVCLCVSLLTRFMYISVYHYQSVRSTVAQLIEHKTGG